MNYPKMLYKGNQKEYQHIIAENAAQEELLIDEGWKDFADIPELDDLHSPDMKNVDGTEHFISAEQFDKVAEDLVQKELQLNVARTERDEFKAEIDRLKGVIAAGSAENAGLREQLAALQQPTSTGAAAGDLSTLTTEQLREMVTAQGKTFKQRDSKPELIAILES